MMRKKAISFLWCTIVAVCCTAQTAGYKFYAPLDSVKSSGFYNIELTPELSAHLKTDYSDLRVVNDSGKWVPHVLHYPASERCGLTLYIDQRIVKKETTGSFTTLIVAASQAITSNLLLTIRNTTAERFCTLSGSDDNKSWFVINDSILINPTPGNKSTSNSFRIDFPPTNYNFFKLVIDNKNKAPFNISDVMHETSAFAMMDDKPKFLQNPQTIIEQKDSGKISYIKITQQQAFHFAAISLKLAGVKYFSRNIELYIPSSGNHSFSNPGQLLHSFSVSNNSTLQFNVPLVNPTVFYLLIHNEDNLPLQVTAVTTSIGYRYITPYLEKGNKYTLLTGNASATRPYYDLADIPFSDSTPLLSFKKITAVKETPADAPVKKNNRWILWAAIIAALFILLLFTQKMLKEVDKRKDNDSI